jgi:ABC-type sugar transport system ATPase subunit
MVRIKLENVSKFFGNKVVVDNVNLEVKDGEFFCLLGPSGCGKTTTLRMIAGVEKPTSGTIYFDDTPVNDLPPKDRNVTLMFQSYALYPHMNVYDNLAYPLKKIKASKDEIDKRVREVAEMLKIDKLLDRLPKHLSGGEKQRVALGRAIIKKPKVCLLDEPLTNLDAKIRVQMRGELKQLCNKLKMTFIMATPDQLEAITMAERIAVMNNGKIIQVGTSEEVYNKPNSLFVAGFVGSPPMNFIDCSLIESGGRFYLDAGAFKYDVTDMAETIKEKATSNQLTLGIRPEHVKIKETREKDAILGEVMVIEYTRPEIIVNLRIKNLIIKALAPEGFYAKAGENLWISFEKVYVYDKKRLIFSA